MSNKEGKNMEQIAAQEEAEAPEQTAEGAENPREQMEAMQTDIDHVIQRIGEAREKAKFTTVKDSPEEGQAKEAYNKLSKEAVDVWTEYLDLAQEVSRGETTEGVSPEELASRITKLEDLSGKSFETIEGLHINSKLSAEDEKLMDKLDKSRGQIQWEAMRITNELKKLRPLENDNSLGDEDLRTLLVSTDNLQARFDMIQDRYLRLRDKERGIQASADELGKAHYTRNFKDRYAVLARKDEAAEKTGAKADELKKKVDTLRKILDYRMQHEGINNPESARAA